MNQTPGGGGRALSRRELLAASCLALLGGPGCRSEPRPLPNILWIVADDLSPDLGCYGNLLVRTPNIDGLAADGAVYTNAISAAAVHAPARAALATGMHATSIGAHNGSDGPGEAMTLPEGILSLTDSLGEAGYHTSRLAGLPADGAEGPQASDWSEREAGQLFWAQANLRETRRPFARADNHHIDPALVELPPSYPDYPAVRLDWALYLESVQRLDEQVGRLLTRLDEEGLTEDTAVFFFADQGRAMPRGSQFLYEDGIRIPLVVRLPEKYRPEGFTPGSRRDDLVSAIDITATTLDLAGCEIPATLEGQVFQGPARQPREYAIASRDRCDETMDRMRAVRTARYKYIRNFHPERPYLQPNVRKDTTCPPLQVMRQLDEAGRLTIAQSLLVGPQKPPEELYDLEADPYEIVNLAGSPDHEQPLEELRGVLDSWIAETGDRGGQSEEQLPGEVRLRTHADGWHALGGVLGKNGGRLTLRWEGSAGRLTLPYVMEAEDLSLRFRARSGRVAPAGFFWGTVDNVLGEGNEIELDYQADGAWRIVTVDFLPEGYLSSFGLLFGRDKGEIAFDWFRLYRRRGRNRQLIRGWEFEPE